jgi:hydrogenase maturation protein HypF
MANQHTRRVRIAVTGQVQGVGFRPYVYRLAAECQLGGWVLNGPGGVVIEAEAAPAGVEEFLRRLPGELPPLASIASLVVEDIPSEGASGPFAIRPSAGGQLADAQVTVDTATCEQCLAEMNDPANPRYRYPFINCTNCGPRYSIVRRIPYDRPNTTMGDFAMCPLCSGEYRDPASRRFHAQPIACERCGPGVWLVDTAGRQIDCDDAVVAAVGMLRAGKILAIKGMGGFHLACRADSEQAVARLRLRKHRDAKPFALMAADVAAARQLCRVDPAAERLLAGPLRPVVIMPRLADAPVAPAVGAGYDTLGIMLPYTPLHHLLFAEGLGPLVMTSGNYSDEPLVKDNDSAVAHLGAIADAMLLHNRRIERRVDDSVVRMAADGSARVIRRARGYAPTPVRLPVGRSGPAVLAVGSELKNTVCLARDGRAVVSEHVGDLKDGRVYRHFIDTINHLEELFDIQPALLAADLHPAYLSSQYAAKRHRGELAGREPLPITHVQHHHAHAAACLAEHGLDEPVVAVVCDGVGYGPDGAVWGCEVLRCDLATYERVGHLRYIPLIGGDAAAVETWRPATAAIHDAFGADAARIISELPALAGEQRASAAIEMLDSGMALPRASSLGRWFDAVAGMCGLTPVNRCEGEAPMKLEAAAARGTLDAYAFRLVSAGPFQVDLRPMVEGMAFDLIGGADVPLVAARFHNTVVRFLASAARRACEETRLGKVVLSGGCFANRRVSDGLVRELADAGLEVLEHRDTPCNDGAISLGQAAVAQARAVAGMPAPSGAVDRTENSSED